jgi:hypothetical protein
MLFSRGSLIGVTGFVSYALVCSFDQAEARISSVEPNI